ncbi:RagB/SusD family nutrient uptake outer membrane protein [Pedobacter hiemivivus]|uniref:RagB/SusD family nutrient uptake outer membrane protein n=1 Tax=Pedobacter hiemivivus TaxID=2530454 RepID=A0A4U1GGR5_9SPHI|nr:RagB/SusD family nutrient uptake outer membrane protein [Pedobacter hiemivivus]TKC62200.1 RagB/SusD family nutrient uptake outer membrane protein [Pedobacter hiemivivus]
MKRIYFFVIVMVTGLGTLFSCKKFIEIDPPKNSLIPATVFKSNDLATSAILGIYQQMAALGFASGDAGSISTICALSADEFIGYQTNLKLVFENQISPEVSITNDLWTSSYKRIYDANAILEGLELEGGITPPVKIQLQGEAYFIRAFNYFYLVNLYGPVPLHLSTDYQLNSKAVRRPVNEIYDQIIKDLKAAELCLQDNYASTGRVRPNKATVHALLARTYLYLGDWANAEKYSTFILEKNSAYKLVGLDQIFLSNSLETIWQLMPAAGTNTPAGAFLILTGVVPPTFVSLRADFAEQAFESNDARKPAWVKSILANGTTYYYPFKYKVKSSATVSEYTTVFRLAEQFLIRSEARARQNNLIAAIDDLDAIRNRAGIPLMKVINPGISKENLLIAIQKERRVELFSEWGDRWLDLKRNGKSTAVLAPIKPNWKPDYVLYPIPYVEISRNRNITPNSGY